ncbi:MAG: hypothetical protein JO022_06505, partial [Acidobacteriaceae bacterium]|nr:hypothetical protein [Acidobacteriaceae bacterium]
AFDGWCAQRDAQEANAEAAKYVPPTLIGYEDLGQYGDWTQIPEYGPIWCPRRVDAGWSPYHYGHWAWIEPWGWTWVDDAPWGFAPFHYGRWVYWHERWAWAPGPVAVVAVRGPVVRPVYAPALVAWFGGKHWSVSVTAGPSLGWVALGFGEVFTPHYACSRPYFTNVNVYNTRIVKTVNITNVYETVYVRKTVYEQTFVNVRAPHGVVAMPQSEFASGRPVHQAGFVLRETDIARIHEEHVLAPPVAPTRFAVAASPAHPVSHPDIRIVHRDVIAKNVPPVQPVAFAARQPYLQQHAGQPHNFVAMHQAVAPQQAPTAFVRQASQIHPAAPAGNTSRQEGLERRGNGQEHFNPPPNAPVHAQPSPSAYPAQAGQSVQPHYDDRNRRPENEQFRQSEPNGRRDQAVQPPATQQPRNLAQPQPQLRAAPVEKPEREQRPNQTIESRPVEEPHSVPRPPESPRASEHAAPQSHQETHPESHPAASHEESHHEAQHADSHHEEDHHQDQKDQKK